MTFNVMGFEVEHNEDADNTAEALISAGATNVKIVSTDFDKEIARIKFDAPNRTVAQTITEKAVEFGGIVSDVQENHTMNKKETDTTTTVTTEIQGRCSKHKDDLATPVKGVKGIKGVRLCGHTDCKTRSGYHGTELVETVVTPAPEAPEDTPEDTTEIQDFNEIFKTAIVHLENAETPEDLTTAKDFMKTNGIRWVGNESRPEIRKANLDAVNRVKPGQAKKAKAAKKKDITNTTGKTKGNGKHFAKWNGISMCALLRWLGANGVDTETVGKVAHQLGYSPRIPTLNTQVYWGKKGINGITVLSKEHATELKGVVKEVKSKPTTTEEVTTVTT